MDRAAYRELRRKGLCVQDCGRKAYGRTRCDRCQARTSANRKKWRKQCKERQKCMRCLVDVAEGRSVCDECTSSVYGKNSKGRYVRARDRAKELGRCMRCDKESAKLSCDDCNIVRNEARRRLYWKRRDEGLCTICHKNPTDRSRCEACAHGDDSLPKTKIDERYFICRVRGGRRHKWSRAERGVVLCVYCGEVLPRSVDLEFVK